MQELWNIAWHRFNVIQAVVSDANARIIAVLFYFTILLPFGLIYTLTSDPLRRRGVNAGQEWLQRPAVPTDIQSARQQG